MIKKSNVGRPKGFKHTKEWKEDHAKRMVGKNNPFYGKKHSDSTKIKMSNNHADFSGDKNPFKNSLKDPIKLKEFKDRCVNTWDNRSEEKITEMMSSKKTGYEGISGTIWASIKGNAKTRKIPFLITIKYAWDLFLRQDKKCALSGLYLEFGHGYLSKHFRSKTTASLDRINSKLGYIEGNVQWVHKDINLMKWKLPQERFIDMCKKVTENATKVFNLSCR